MCGMSQQSPDRSTASPPARPDASMSLLNNVMDHSLDDGYAEASARRRADGSAGLPRTLKSKLGLAAGLVVAALVVTLGAAEARISAPVVAKEREELIDRIDAETRAADTLESDVDELRSDVSERQRKALEQHGGDQGQLVALLAGATPVEGPGVKLIVDDAKNTDQGGGGPRESTGFADTGRVRDRDMQRVVNGLWESGAEAIAINGQRLTALSAIRAARRRHTGRQQTARTAVHGARGGGRQEARDRLPGQRRRPVPSGAQGELRHPHQHLRSGGGAASGRTEPDRPYSRAEGRRQWCGRHREGHIVIAVLGLVVGVVVGLLVRPEVPAVVEPYLPIAVVAALDAVFGGLRAMLDGIFVDKVFVVSFLSNVVVAALIVFLGDKLGVGAQLSTGVVVVLGIRIFSNAAAIRRRRLPGLRPMNNDENPRSEQPEGGASAAPDASAPPPAAEVSGRQRLKAGLWPPRLSRAQLIVAVLLFGLGLGLAIQVRSTSDDSALRGARQEDLVRILDEVDDRTQRLEDEKQRLDDQRTELENSSDQAEEARKQTLEKERQLGILAGTVAAQGPGITLTITDPSGAVAPDMLLDAIQELRAAGAEAIQVNGVRVVANTYFSGDAGDVEVDGKKIEAPYEFTVIGKPQDLEPALNIPGGVVQTLEKEQATVLVERSDEIVVDALRPAQRPDYARSSSP